jgi:type II secretory pathway component PulF
MKMKNINLNEIFSKIKERFQIQKAGTIKLSAKEKINLLEQLSNLINSGIPITNAFSIISYQTKDPKIKSLILNLSEKINK